MIIPIISIIIPVYKTERYLERLVQSLNNLPLLHEILIINDHSPLFSKGIIKTLFYEYNYRIISHDENKGLYQARLTGLKAAKGIYISQLDSDDWVSNYYFTETLKLATDYDADMVEFDFSFAEESEGSNYVNKHPGFYTHRPNIEIYEEQNHLHRMLREKTAHFQWNRIYKRSLFESIKDILPKDKRINVAEDLILTSALLTKTKRLVRTNQPLYNYYRRNGALTNDLTYDSLKNRIWEDWYSYEYLKTLDCDKDNPLQELIDDNQRDLIHATLERIDESCLSDGKKSELRKYTIASFTKKNLQRLSTDRFLNHNTDLSIIVTVYNTEHYLDKCIGSLVGQIATESFKLEIIVINDCSPSSNVCRDIVNKFQENDSCNIKYIELEENVGLYNARQIGVEHSEGEYIGFVDSDDWVDPCMYSEMLLKAYLQQYDVVECGFSIFRKGGIEEHIEPSKSIYEHQIGRAVYRLPPSEHIFRHEIWSKIYRRDLWNRTESSFPVRRKGYDGGEDLVRVSMLLFEARSYCYLPKSYYFYNMKREGSASQRVSRKPIERYIYGIALYIEEMENFTHKYNDIELTTLALVNNKIWGDIFALFLRIAHVKLRRERKELLNLYLNRFQKIIFFIFAIKADIDFISVRYNKLYRIRKSYKEFRCIIESTDDSFFHESICFNEVNFKDELICSIDNMLKEIKRAK